MIDQNHISEFTDTAVRLAQKVIELKFKGDQIVFPIDPFEILSECDVVYQFRDFKDLEGIYLIPESHADIAVVGINNNRPITRQRFTAAHELCHHLKDRDGDTLCPSRYGEKDSNERFADQFASELLMPRGYFEVEANKVAKNGYISLDSALYLSDLFGVSFESCVFTLAYRLRMIEGNTSAKQLRKLIRKYRPNQKRMELGFKKYDQIILDQLLNSYKYFFENDSKHIWYKFKNDFVYNENRLEGIDIDLEEVSEILTDIRLHGTDSEYCKSEYQGIIEVAGHAALYEYIHETEDVISAFSILNLNKRLYQFAPFPDLAGRIRTTNNLVTKAEFETVDYSQVPGELAKLDKVVKETVSIIDDISISEFIETVVMIHHRITVIHPFDDGNGRVSRVFLNWLFAMKGLPPVYLKFKDKIAYYDALKAADIEGDYAPLKLVFCHEVIHSMIQLNTRFNFE